MYTSLKYINDKRGGQHRPDMCQVSNPGRGLCACTAYHHAIRVFVNYTSPKDSEVWRSLLTAKYTNPGDLSIVAATQNGKISTMKLKPFIFTFIRARIISFCYQHSIYITLVEMTDTTQFNRGMDQWPWQHNRVQPIIMGTMESK